MNISRIAFLGAGKIAEAWIERLVASGAFLPTSIFACDPSAPRLEQLQARHPGLKTSCRNEEGAEFAEVVVIAIPPPDVVHALAGVRCHLKPETIVISVAAGVSLVKLHEAASGSVVLRVMPNTPCMVGEGMNLVCFTSDTPSTVRERVGEFLKIFGQTLEIAERDMEAYGALCSVGPTFLFPMIASLISAAVAAGIPEDQARAATAQVFAGTGRLVAGTERTLAELNGMIGLHTMDEESASKLVSLAYRGALTKLQGLATKMASA